MTLIVKDKIFFCLCSFFFDDKRSDSLKLIDFSQQAMKRGKKKVSSFTDVTETANQIECDTSKKEVIHSISMYDGRCNGV